MELHFKSVIGMEGFCVQFVESLFKFWYSIIFHCRGVEEIRKKLTGTVGERG